MSIAARNDPWSGDSLARLDYMDTLGAGWDGPGSIALDPHLLKVARAIVTSLTDAGITTFISPLDGGESIYIARWYPDEFLHYEGRSVELSSTQMELVPHVHMETKWERMMHTAPVSAQAAVNWLTPDTINPTPAEDDTE